MQLYKTAPALVLATILGLAPIASTRASSDATTLADVRHEVSELLQTLKGYSVEQRDEALEQVNTALQKLDGRIDALENRVDRDWDKMDQAARREARETLRALREQRTELAEWYGGWKHSSSKAWGEMKKGFSKAYQSISEAWEKAEKEVTNDK